MEIIFIFLTRAIIMSVRDVKTKAGIVCAAFLAQLDV